MPRPGSNLPGFRAVQLGFADHIRNSQTSPTPDGVDPRRMQIYVELFYNNIERFLASGFPVLKQILGDAHWHRLTREFVHTHPSESPYFLEISQEFLTFLDRRELDDLPPFVLELAHYEWVELALGVSELELPGDGFDAGADLLDAPALVSPLVWLLAYRWPVHEIGPGNVPTVLPESGTELIVHRRADDRVHFMVVNPVTHRLVGLLQSGATGRQALDTIAGELPQVAPGIVYEQGIATLAQLREAQIILGARISTD